MSKKVTHWILAILLLGSYVALDHYFVKPLTKPVPAGIVKELEKQQEQEHDFFMLDMSMQPPLPERPPLPNTDVQGQPEVMDEPLPCESSQKPKSKPRPKKGKAHQGNGMGLDMNGKPIVLTEIEYYIS
jgi:hypothetical protein